MADYIWEDWQLELLDDYLLGYINFKSQEELANKIGKNLNTVKVKLSRRRKKLEEQDREITIDEYLTILSNRFTKTTEQIAVMIQMPKDKLSDKMDEMDCIECKEHLSKNFEFRPITNDEYEIFIKLYYIKKLDKMHIAHILNRNIITIEEMITEYERI